MINSDVKEKPVLKVLPDSNEVKKHKQWPEILTIEQVAEYLQIPLAEIHPYQKQMPGKMIFGKWRIQKNKLDGWIDSQADRISSYHKAEISNQKPKEQPEPPASEFIKLTQTIPANTKKIRGVIKWFSSNRQDDYGFIEAEDGRKVFVHTQYIKKNRGQPFKIGDAVEFEIIQAPKGWTAINVAVLSTSSEVPISDTERTRGTIKKFFPSQNYGFIETEDFGDVYVNTKNMKNLAQSLKVGDTIEFEIIRTSKGRLSGRNVTLLSSRPDTSIPEKRDRKAEQLHQEALAAKERGKTYDARKLFERSIDYAPRPYTFLSYAAMEEKTRRPESALQILQRGIQALPSEGILYQEYAMCLRKRNELKGAEEILREGLQKAPNFAKQLHLGLAIVLAELDDDKSLQEAVYHSEQAEKLGMPLGAMPELVRNKLRVITAPPLGREARNFLKRAGFEVSVKWFTNDYVDFIVTSKQVEYTESYDLKGRILARCFFRKIQWKDIEKKLLYNIRRPAKAYRGINLNNDIGFLIINDVTPWEDALYRLMENNREVIIPIDRSLIINSKDEESIDVFRDVMDKWLSRRDLFHEKFPVSGRRFFGRQSELQNLMRNIDDGEHTGIYGLRKVGKTSLMFQLREKRPQDLVVYIDLQEVMLKDCAFLYWKIIRGLQKAIVDKKKAGLMMKDVKLKLGTVSDYEMLDNPEEKNALRFDSDINRLLNVLTANEKTTYSKIVITIDELELMLPGAGRPGFKGYAEFFAHLRGIAQRTQGKLVSVVTAANSAISEQGTWESRDNPVFQFYKEMFLPPLVQEECNEMIEKLGRGMNVSFDSESLVYLYSETGGHPYIIRQLCSHIVQQHPSRPLHINPTLVDENIDSFIRDKGDIFKEILDRLDYFPQEKILFERIVEGDSEESRLAKLISEPIDIALRHLLGYQIVECRDDKYQIKINLLSRWLKRFQCR